MNAKRANLLVPARVCTTIVDTKYTAITYLLFMAIALTAPSVLGSEQKPQTPDQKWVSAIANDRVALLKQMLDQHIHNKSQSQTFLRIVASNGKSALMVASKEGDLDLAKRIVELGANVNELTQTGGTPLMFAVLGNHVALAQWLHQAGANINAKGSNGWSAATIAGAKGQTDMLRWLITAGADIDSPDVYRFTPLMRAVDNRHTESIKILLVEGQAGVNFKDESGNSALHFAVANKQRDVVKLLLNHGANPTQANRDGITPIDLAETYPEISPLFDQ